ncbi:S-adenosyl-L-methionine-dependent methyltransferase [Aureobasidium subglaciale]|nr:S-adenosyl-L-methionine-dependent methyltransferase [Aureobasidium subglaciale]
MSSTTTTVTPMLKVNVADWDRTAKSYAQTGSKGPMSIPIQGLVGLLNKLEPLDSASAILDVGCGSGAVISHIIDTYAANMDSTTQLLSTDFSSVMVSLVTQLRKAKLAELSAGCERDLWSQVTPLILDAMDMRPLLNDSISHIIASFVFFMTADPAKALAESHRVLGLDGVLACSSWHKMMWMENLVIAADRALTPREKKVPVMPQFPRAWSTAEDVREQLANAGFRDIQTEYIEAPIIILDVETWSHSFIASGNPAVTWITDVLDVAEVEQVEKQLVQVIKEKCEVNEQGAYILSGIAVLAAGRK